MWWMIAAATDQIRGDLISSSLSLLSLFTVLSTLQLSNIAVDL